MLRMYILNNCIQ